MKDEFTAIIEPAPEGGFWAICPEVPGANGQCRNAVGWVESRPSVTKPINKACKQ